MYLITFFCEVLRSQLHPIHNYTGACVRIEKDAPGLLPLVYFACRRHKLERDLNAVWRTAFPGRTTAPADKLCEQVFQQFEQGKFPETLDDKCPHILPAGSPFFQRQREKFAKIAAEMDETSENDNALPRDDYRYLLNLIKVCVCVCFHVCIIVIIFT